MTLKTSNTKNPAQFNDFFALFGLPVQFSVDETALNLQYRALQKQYHPDKLSDTDTNSTGSESDHAAAQSSGFSALINHAYQTLKAPDTRATYLLEMVEQAESLNDSIADLDFLDDAMDLRIALDEAIQDGNLTTLQQLKPQIATRLQSQSTRFEQAYSKQDWVNASDATQKLKFLVKLNADVLSGIDAIANQAGADDDDLYV